MKKQTKRTQAKSKSNQQSASKGVKYTRDELNNSLLLYYMIRDCVEGEPAVKGMISTGYNGGVATTLLSRAKRYLPMPNPENISAENEARYLSYVQRAVFYNVTGRTLDGLAGQIFLRNPEIKLPELLTAMEKDADGGGLSMTQLARRAVRNVLPYGRSGILVDFPQRDEATTVADIKSGKILPTITVYHPWDIINWRVRKINGKRQLTLVVLRDTQEDESDDGFEVSTSESFRVLRLDEETGGYTVEMFTGGVNDTFDSDNVVIEPKDANGQRLTYIPFTFIGAENNDAHVDKPPFYDLAALNIGHYRNSADYEEACFLTGQPTPVATGLSADWVDNVLKGQIMLGSRSFVPLPVGGDAKLLQANPNIMPIEAMKHKEEQMVALGAKLVQRSRTTRASATEVIVETTSESSVLTNVSVNTSQAFEWALGVAAEFVGANKDEIVFKLNKDFDLTKMTPEGVAQVVKAWQSGAVAFVEMREVLRRSELATIDDAEAQGLIKKEQADMAAIGPVVDPFGAARAAGAGGGQ